MKYRKAILACLLLLVAAIATVWLYRYLQQPSVEGVLKRTAREINAQCPMPLDADTRLDSVLVLDYPIRTFQFNCTLLTTIGDSVSLRHTEAYFQPRLLEKVRTDPAMAYLRDHSIVLSYRYHDQESRFLFDYLIGPADYLYSSQPSEE